MGLVRKTLSVGTLGLVSFRSKKEQLRRTDRARVEAETALEAEHAARERAESRIIAAEKRLKQVEAETVKVTHKLAGERGKRRKRRAAELAGAAERGRRAGRRARKAAKRASVVTKETIAPRAEEIAEEIGRKARKAAKRASVVTKETVAPRAEHVVAKVGEAIDQR